MLERWMNARSLEQESIGGQARPKRLQDGSCVRIALRDERSDVLDVDGWDVGARGTKGSCTCEKKKAGGRTSNKAPSDFRTRAMSVST